MFNIDKALFKPTIPVTIRIPFLLLKQFGRILLHFGIPGVVTDKGILEDGRWTVFHSKALNDKRAVEWRWRAVRGGTGSGHGAVLSGKIRTGGQDCLRAGLGSFVTCRHLLSVKVTTVTNKDPNIGNTGYKTTI